MSSLRRLQSTCTSMVDSTDYDGGHSLTDLQISMIMANEVSINPNYNTQ